MKGLADHAVNAKDLVMFLGIATTLASLAFGYGRLTQKVEGVESRITRMENYLVPPNFKVGDATTTGGATASAGITAITP